MALAATAATSCQDWLTVYPQTQVVEEEFWEDKNDLEGVRYAAYQKMAGNIQKMMLWGELRSDNHVLWGQNNDGDFINTAKKYQDIIDAHLERDSTFDYFDWSGFYTTINYCNKVLQHGQEVLDRDKQFTRAEWREMRAEMKGLRALNYFYLLRAFKDVPYTTQVINNDTEVRDFPAVNQLVVLDSLIADVDTIKDQARKRYESYGSFSGKSETKSKLTRAAIYALLSDMYLWRASLHQGRGISADQVKIYSHKDGKEIIVPHTVKGDYELCCTYADEAIKLLNEQLQDQNGSYGSSFYEKFNVTGLPVNVSLTKNNFESFTDGGDPILNAHYDIFVSGSSDESIFELSFNSNDNRKNDMVNDFWGNNTNHYFASLETQLDNAFGSETTVKTRDARLWLNSWKNIEGEATGLPQNCCFKWQDVVATVPSGDQLTSNIKLMPESSSYRNWIIYRLSDVMLQKAEALACLSVLEGANDAGQKAEALKLVNAIHRRWYCNDNKSASQPSTDVSSIVENSWGTAATTNANLIGNLPKPKLNGVDAKYTHEVAVMNERQLELYAEGKRWFDLVRFAERHANDNGAGQGGIPDPREYTDELPISDGRDGVKLMVDQFFSTLQNAQKTSLKTQIKNRYGLYNLIYYMEIKASNGVLEQNPVWNKSIYEN